jgi:hypothetical protein
LVTQAATGCLYDSDDPCGEGMVVYGDNVRCVCPEGTTKTSTGCVACGEHEVPSATGCICDVGYSRPDANSPCTMAPTGLGADCDPSAPDCESSYDHCEPSLDSGYCTTSGCAANEDCEGGYRCNSDSICERPPVGLGVPCTTPEECAGTEATFCDTLVAHACLVEGCAPGGDDCFTGYACCDLTMFGLPAPVCVPEGTCPL